MHVRLSISCWRDSLKFSFKSYICRLRCCCFCWLFPLNFCFFGRKAIFFVPKSSTDARTGINVNFARNRMRPNTSGVATTTKYIFAFARAMTRDFDSFFFVCLLCVLFILFQRFCTRHGTPKRRKRVEMLRRKELNEWSGDNSHQAERACEGNELRRWKSLS